MSKIDLIKNACEKYGFDLRAALAFVNGEITFPDSGQAHMKRNQKKINTIWNKHCFPWEHCIVKAPYGQHIQIKCISCDATGTTKNIDFIGARTLFIDCKCEKPRLKTVLPEIQEFENLTNNIIY